MAEQFTSLPNAKEMFAYIQQEQIKLAEEDGTLTWIETFVLQQFMEKKQYGLDVPIPQDKCEVVIKHWDAIRHHLNSKSYRVRLNTHPKPMILCVSSNL
jgi:hypothetical protein